MPNRDLEKALESFHQEVTADDVAAFLFGAPLTVDSSWIEWAQYDADEEVLTIATKGGRTYDTPGVSPDLAESFARAPSKGKWVHCNLPWRTSSCKDGRHVASVLPG